MHNKNCSIMLLCRHGVRFFSKNGTALLIYTAYFMDVAV